MSKPPVALTALSLSKSVSEVPLEEHQLVVFDLDRDYQRIWTLEWFWGLSKGALPLESSLNRYEMRADMLQAYREDGFMLIPTAHTLNDMLKMLRRNKRAAIDAREVFTESFSSQYHEYELRLMGLKGASKRPTIYIDTGEAAPRAIAYPYEDLPNVKSRAHPFFVLYLAHKIIMSQGLLYYAHEVKPICSPILRITRLWQKSPPVEFIYGPPLSNEHRHPLSLADDADRPIDRYLHAPDELGNYRKPSSAHGGARVAEERSNSLATLPLQLGKRKRQGATEALADAPPRRCSRTIPLSVAEKDLYATRSEILAWLNGVHHKKKLGLPESTALPIASVDAIDKSPLYSLP